MVIHQQQLLLFWYCWQDYNRTSMDAHASGVGRSTCDPLPAQKFPRSAQQIFHTAAVLVVVVSYCFFVIRNREPACACIISRSVRIHQWCSSSSCWCFISFGWQEYILECIYHLWYTNIIVVLLTLPLNGTFIECSSCCVAVWYRVTTVCLLVGRNISHTHMCMPQPGVNPPVI